MHIHQTTPTPSRARAVRGIVSMTAVATLALGACSLGSSDQAPRTTRANDTAPDTTASPAKPVIDPGDGGRYQPKLTAADVVGTIDNPYLPFTAGSRWVYEGTSQGEAERIEIEVLAERREIQGMQATVVHDSVFVADKLVEDTYDWYVQDRAGNVWYLGEEVRDYENGRVVSTKGSWESGIEGALPGIVMPGKPTEGFAFRQEYKEAEAEDMAEVIGVGGTDKVPAGTYADVISTRDWTPLEPDVVEEKAYAPGVGKIREGKVSGGSADVVLIAYTRGR